MKEQSSVLNNIIGDCIQMNTDIINQYNDSKLPKFIIKLLILRKKRKLLDCVNKIKRGNAPLTRFDLFTFINYYSRISFRYMGRFKEWSYLVYSTL